MTAHTEDMNTLREQLSAWMDGELSAEESRFLQRRMEHDATLRAEYERWQLASAALKRQPLKLASANFADKVGAALQTETPRKQTRSWLPWAAAASVALGLMIFYPQFQTPDTNVDVAVSKPATDDVVPIMTASSTAPSLANADMVVDFSAPDEVLNTAADTTPASPANAGRPLIASQTKQASLPDTFSIPASKPWPKTSVIANDPSMDAMLIRHNQMAESQGMNGFVPYVDVVADDESSDVADSEAVRNGEVVR
jgi:anti-sigma factor RsiW